MLASRPLSGCWNGHHPHFSHATWFIALAFESYLFALVSYQAYKKYAHYGAFMGIFKLMFRDAIAWFFFIAALIGWNAFSWLGGVVSFLLHAICTGLTVDTHLLTRFKWPSLDWLRLPGATFPSRWRVYRGKPSTP